jgi:hydrogenase maturation protease
VYKALVVGFGNPFRRDDGIGPAVIRRLQSEGSLKGFELLDGGTDGFLLLELAKQYEQIVIVDAVDMGMTPGEIRVFAPEEAKLMIHTDALSTHGFGLAEVIALMEKLAVQKDLRIIGVQVKDVSFGERLSPEIASKIGEILGLLKKL